MHEPVLLQETLDLLDSRPGQTIVDCTLGGGGHALQLAKRVGEKGKVVAMDYDQQNIDNFLKRKEEEQLNNIQVVKANFARIEEELSNLKIKKVAGILADLGFSSDQLEQVEGLSFQQDGFLDMRLDSQAPRTAADILNQEPKEEIERILKELGEERRADTIAEKIVKYRRDKPIERSVELRQLIEDCYESRTRVSGIGVATKTFMALRIAVNQELENLTQLLEASKGLLEKGGRIVIISFHSLEDRMVKRFFQRESRKCICDEDQLRCTCDHRPVFKILTKKPVVPAAEEIKQNPRSRSAKLRGAEKLE